MSKAVNLALLHGLCLAPLGRIIKAPGLHSPACSAALVQTRYSILSERQLDSGAWWSALAGSGLGCVEGWYLSGMLIENMDKRLYSLL